MGILVSTYENQSKNSMTDFNKYQLHTLEG
jgi:hypothetical protein